MAIYRSSRRALPTEFIYQLFALLISFIIIHGVYVALVRPSAAAFLVQEQALMEVDPGRVAEQSIFVIVKDYEQEGAFVLMIWALSILGYKGRNAYRQQRQLEEDLIGRGEDILMPGDVPGVITNIEHALDEGKLGFLLPRALITALERFVATRHVQDAAHAVNSVCEAEATRMESELSIIRYIAWAIPSIGFIGTVRGIGNALALAHQAVEGDISGVTQNLGTAFNSTFVALVLSIILMFLVHQVQLMQERLVLDTGNYCDDCLVRFLRSDLPG